MKQIKNTRAFTLVEALVSVLLVTIVSAASWMAVSSLSPAAYSTRNIIRAENLMTKSQEEVRRIAQSRFDDLEACSFNAGNACGFSDMSAQYPEFQRELHVTREAGSELKRAYIHETWNVPGEEEPRHLDSVILLARPPEAQPGNVIGSVTDNDTGDLLPNVSVTVTNVGTKATRTAPPSSATATGGGNVNYNAAEAGTGRFLLLPGRYRLTATAPGYLNYAHPTEFNIDSNLEQQVDFAMTFQPKPGSIRINLKNDTDGGAAKFISYNNSLVTLFKEGVQKDSTYTNWGILDSHTFPISFTEAKQQCFTVRTQYAFHSGFVGNFGCTFPFTADGWSSAQAGDDNAVIGCANPWNGNKASDRICLGPGDAVVKDIHFVKPPTATVSGRIYDTKNNPAPIGTRVSVFWHDGYQYTPPIDPNHNGVVTDANGSYSIFVPAVNVLFSGKSVSLSATVQVNSVGCCKKPTLVNKTGTITVSNLRPDDNVSRDIVIDVSDTPADCGNAQGLVIDDKASLAAGVPVELVGASINLAYTPTIKTISMKYDGPTPYNYAFMCPNNSETDYSLPVSNGYYEMASAKDYYSFNPNADGLIYYNWWLNGGAYVPIKKNQKAIASTVGLWPKGYGTVSGTVTRSGDNQPMEGVSVMLIVGTTGAAFTAVTNNKGKYSFPINGNPENKIPETWPPPDLPNNQKYNQTAKQHALSIKAFGIYQDYTSGYFKLNAGEDKTIDIVLSPPGSM